VDLRVSKLIAVRRLLPCKISLSVVDNHTGGMLFYFQRQAMPYQFRATP
jgi:hypothetical protein